MNKEGDNKMRQRLKQLSLMIMILIGMTVIQPVFAFGDDLGTVQTGNGNQTTTTTNQPSTIQEATGIKKQKLDEGGDAMVDFLQNYHPVTSEQMQEGEAIARPISDLIGKVITIGLAFLTVWLFLQTVIDMAYILIPPLQPTLSGAVQVQGKVSRCWVTSEALQAGGSAMPRQAGPMRQGYGASGMGMGSMGMGMGSMGMGMNSPMGGAGAQKPQQTSSNMLGTYFKSRVVTLVLFGICVVLLFSNIFLGFGSILGEWIYTIFKYIGAMLS